MGDLELLHVTITMQLLEICKFSWCKTFVLFFISQKNIFGGLGPSMKIFLSNKSILRFQVEQDYPHFRKHEQFAAFVATHVAVGELLACKKVQRAV